MVETLTAYAASRAKAQARARQDPTLIPHGTPSGYSYWACRCWRCTEHSTERRNRQRSARRTGGAS